MKYVHFLQADAFGLQNTEHTQANETKTQQRMQPGAHTQHCVVNRRCALLAVDQWSSASRTHPFK